MKKSKHQQYFHCFVCILVPYAFWFSYQQNIVTILISVAFRGVTHIRGAALTSMWILKGAALTRGRRSFQERRLFEEIRYIEIKYLKFMKLLTQGGHTDCMFLCHVRVSERIYTLQLPECQEAPYSKKARNSRNIF